MDRFFTTENTVISFVGDVSIAKLTKLLEHEFQHYRRSKPIEIGETFTPNPAFRIRSKEANYQTHAVIGGIAPSYLNEERRPMALLTNILGGPALNSRLTLSIREKYGYSYNVEANYTPYVDTGFWSVYLGTDQKYLSKSVALVYKELKLLRTKKLGSLQLNRSKEQLKGHLALGMDSNSGLMLGLGKSLLLFNQIDTIQEIYAGIDKITASDLLEIANKYMDRDNCSELLFDLIS
jgi:predicted Zn-dependent peptidase